MIEHKMLVVDHDPDIVNILKIYFTGQGYKVQSAQNGINALEKLHSEFPDVVIINDNLSDISGHTVRDMLSRDHPEVNIPFIFMIQNAPRNITNEPDLSLCDYVSSPFDIEELRLRVQNTLAKSKSLNQD